MAIEMPAAIRQALEDLLSRLGREVRDVKWAKVGTIHLTLKFLGEVEEGRIGPLAGALGCAAEAGDASCPVEIAGLGTFGDRDRPHVVWAGVVDPASALKRLHIEVERACADVGYQREDRPFRPHLTLARLKSPSRSLEAALKSIGAPAIGSFEARSFALYQSLLTPTGALHTRLREFPLGRDGRSRS